MKKILGYELDWLVERNAINTVSEIINQPNVWRKLIDELVTENAKIKSFIDPLLNNEDLKIILTGAGSSEYAGNTLALWLAAKTKRNVQSIATTDLVSNPEIHLTGSQPTLLVSFARSGNSPESTAAVELANQLLPNIYHLILTCDENGILHQRYNNSNNTLSLLMPKESNDKGFAMTSSFSSMSLSAIYVLSGVSKEEFSKNVLNLAEVVESKIEMWSLKVKSIAKKDFDRVAIIGSGLLKGIAQESALKLLELTAGKVITQFDAVLGFRHGPKFTINEKTLVVQLFSNNAYTQRYDIDMYNEIMSDGISLEFIGLINEDSEELGDNIIEVGLSSDDDVWVMMGYLVFNQLLALEKSLDLGLGPDNPCPTGEVNRVVKGVSIYPHL